MLKRGGCKSKYFHVVMRVKRKKMFVHKMLTKKKSGYRVMTTLLENLVNIIKIPSVVRTIELMKIFYIAFQIWLLMNKFTFGNHTYYEGIQKCGIYKKANSTPGPSGIGGKLSLLF